MKIIVSLLLIAFTNLLALDATFVPYAAESRYEGVTKDKSSITGLHTKFFTSDYSIELSYENTDFEYINQDDDNSTADSNSTTDKLKQTDLAISYSQLISKNYKINAGAHYITGDNNESHDAKVYFLGLKYFKKNRFDIGADLAYSTYDNNATADDVRQIRVYAGMTFGNYKSKMGKFITKVGATMIYPQYTDSNSTLKSRYSSYDLTVTQLKGAFINKLSWWSGKQMYAVKDRGFTVYNLNELHETGLTISSRYTIDKDMGLMLSYTKEQFIDLDVNQDDSMERLLVSFDYTFR